MNFEITDEIKEKDKEIIFQGLLKYNLERIEDKNPKDLGIYLKNEIGEKIACLIGDTHGNWLFIKYLWVSGRTAKTKYWQQNFKTGRRKSKRTRV